MWCIWGSYCDILKAIFYQLKGDYNPKPPQFYLLKRDYGVLGEIPEPLTPSCLNGPPPIAASMILALFSSGGCGGLRDLRAHWGNIGDIFGVMENKMETTMIQKGIFRYTYIYIYNVLGLRKG